MHQKLIISDSSNCAITETSNVNNHDIYHKCHDELHNHHKHHHHHNSHNQQISHGHNNSHDHHKHHNDSLIPHKHKILKCRENNVKKSNSSSSSSSSSTSPSSSSSYSSSSTSLSSSKSHHHQHKKHDKKHDKKHNKKHSETSIHLNDIVYDSEDEIERKYKKKREVIDLLNIKRKLFVLYKLYKITKKSEEVINIIKLKSTLNNAKTEELYNMTKCFMNKYIQKIKYGIAFVFDIVNFKTISFSHEHIKIGCNLFDIGHDINCHSDLGKLIKICNEINERQSLFANFIKRQILVYNLKYNSLAKNNLDTL